MHRAPATVILVVIGLLAVLVAVVEVAYHMNVVSLSNCRLAILLFGQAFEFIREAQEEIQRRLSPSSLELEISRGLRIVQLRQQNRTCFSLRSDRQAYQGTGTAVEQKASWLEICSRSTNATATVPQGPNEAL